MRADIAEAVDAALAHGATGMLNTDWGDNGHLQYLPISDPGLAFGAAMSWCAATNRDLDLGAALSTHCYDDPTGELGAVVVELGDVHRRLTPQVWNVATMVLHLYFPQLDVGRGPLAGARSRSTTRSTRISMPSRRGSRASRRAAPTPRWSSTSCATRSRWSRS